MTRPLTRPERLLRAGVAGALVALAALFLLLPGISPFSFCGFRMLSGLPCPFCGGTRATLALLRGDLSLAAYLNPLAFAAVLVLLAGIAILLGEATTGRALADWPALWRRGNRVLIIGGTAGILLWWPLHIWISLRTPKKELVDLRHPVTLTLQKWVGAPGDPPDD
mgnify:FL=1|jgi:hypothetical protein